MMTLGNFIMESSLSRLHDKMTKYDIGTITAFRGSLTYAQNKERNRELAAFFLNKGYSITKVKGSYIEDLGGDNPKEVGEESFLVADIKDTGKLLADLKKLGEKYDQDSILFKAKDGEAYLFGTSHRDNSYPGYGKQEKLGNAKFGKVDGQFFSRVSGRQFAFESVEEIPYPDTINGIRAMQIVANRL